MTRARAHYILIYMAIHCMLGPSIPPSGGGAPGGSYAWLYIPVRARDHAAAVVHRGGQHIRRIREPGPCAQQRDVRDTFVHVYVAAPSLAGTGLLAVPSACRCSRRFLAALPPLRHYNSCYSLTAVLDVACLELCRVGAALAGQRRRGNPRPQLTCGAPVRSLATRATTAEHTTLTTSVGRRRLCAEKTSAVTAAGQVQVSQGCANIHTRRLVLHQRRRRVTHPLLTCSTRTSPTRRAIVSRALFKQRVVFLWRSPRLARAAAAMGRCTPSPSARARTTARLGAM